MRRRLKMVVVVELDLEVETTDWDGHERHAYELAQAVECDVQSELNEHLAYSEPEEHDRVQQIIYINADTKSHELVDLEPAI